MILRTIGRNLLRSNRFVGRPLDCAVCIDIECTCDSPVQISPMEVIEVACIKLDLTDGQGNRESSSSKSLKSNNDLYHLDRYTTFHSFAKPVINPELTLFCRELTGITQSVVDRAEPIEQVIDRLIDWLIKIDLIDSQYRMRKDFAFVSCGNFDLSLLSPIIKRCKFNDKYELPIYFREWVNVKKTFINHKKEWPKGLYHMLEILGQEPSGRLHSAEDDCKNLARIVECLRTEGCKLQITSRAS